jgi:Holliday junction resolvase RusA-like endonuclease
MTAEGKALKETCQWEVRAQWKGEPLEGQIAVSVTLYFGTKRRADLDNFNKLSLDALTGIAYLDDSQIGSSRSPARTISVIPASELTLQKHDMILV